MPTHGLEIFAKSANAKNLELELLMAKSMCKACVILFINIEHFFRHIRHSYEIVDNVSKSNKYTTDVNTR